LNSQIYKPTAFNSENKCLACIEWNAFWATELVFVILGEIKVLEVTNLSSVVQLMA
jgi:hypothetical protein